MSNDLKFKISHKVTEDNSSNFTIKPLDRGYGITLGNAMRRVLLTSIPGAAIPHVKNEGVLVNTKDIPILIKKIKIEGKKESSGEHLIKQLAYLKKLQCHCQISFVLNATKKVFLI